MCKFCYNKISCIILVAIVLMTTKPLMSYSQKIQTIVYSSSTVSTFLTKNDTVWIGTTSGIVVMDKNKRILATYPTINGISSINFLSSAIDSSNNLWFGSDKGIFMYNGKDWLNYYQDKWIQDIEVDFNGTIWFATNGGILKYDHNNWTSITNGLSEQITFAVYNDSNNILWVGSNSGIDKFDGQNWKNITTSDGLVNNNVTDIKKDKSENLWVSTACGVSKYNGISWESLLGTNQTFSIGVVNDTIWFGTHNGAYKFYNSNITNYTTSMGLLDNYTKNIIIDKNNSLWFNNSIGFTHYDYSNWVKYSITNNLANNFVLSIAIDTINKTQWIGTSNGLSVFDGVNLKTYNSSDGLVANFIKDIKIDANNNKWISTNGGVSFYNGSSWKNYWNELLSIDTRSISIDSSNNIWVGTYQGLNKFDGTNWSSITVSEGIADNNIITTYIDKSGDLWLGTIKGASVLKDGVWTNYTTNNGLISNYVSAIVQDSTGNYWLGTDSGISKFDGTNWTSYGKDLGTIFCLEIDRLNNLWIGTLDGAYVLKNGILTLYTEFNNLAGNNIYKIKVDNEGFKWIGCNNGLTFFNYFPESKDTSIVYNPQKGNSIIIGKVNATDADGNKLHFSITNESNKLGIFSIDELTGNIHCEKADTLTQKYHLDLKVTDGMAIITSRVNIDFGGSTNTAEIDFNNFIVFPNPANDFVKIKMNENQLEEGFVQLISIEGKVLLQKTFSKMDNTLNIDLSDVNKGIYILNFIYAHKSHNYKLVVN